MAIALESPPRSADPKFAIPLQDDHVVLFGVSWEQYVEAEALLTPSGARLRFLDDQLEIMAPHSPKHEYWKGALGRLIEVFCQHHGIRYSSFGNMTLMDEIRRAGGEPDECYCFHENKDKPDLVIEIALTSGGINKLAFYQRFGTPEVWIWKNETLGVYVLEGEAYRESSESLLLPGIDLNVLAQCAHEPYTSDAIQAFKRHLEQ